MASRGEHHDCYEFARCAKSGAGATIAERTNMVSSTVREDYYGFCSGKRTDFSDPPDWMFLMWRGRPIDDCPDFEAKPPKLPSWWRRILSFGKGGGA